MENKLKVCICRMKQLASIFLLVLLMLFFSDQTSSAFYLGYGGKAMGMGGAFTAVADHTTAYYWNPAGITQLHTKIVGNIGVGGYIDDPDYYLGVRGFPELGNYSKKNSLIARKNYRPCRVIAVGFRF